MKAHNLEAIGYLKLSYTPTEPFHAVRLSDLDKVVTDSVTARAQPVLITNVVPTGEGNVGNKQYAETIPQNQVLLSCVSDTEDLRIYFLAESEVAFYNPTITVNSVAADFITEVQGERRQYTGYIDIKVTADSEIVVNSSTGASATVSIDMADAGPSAATVIVDSLPGTQTAVKSGDTINVSGTVSNDAVALTVLDQSASASGSLTLGGSDSAGSGFRTFSGTAIASSRSGQLSVVVRAANQLGTTGNDVSSSTITLDQVIPTIALTVNSLSNGKQALGLGDTASVTVTLVGQDSQTFEFAHGTEGGSTSSYLTSRTLTVDAEVYDLTNNIAITAARSANGYSLSSIFSVPVSSIAVAASLAIVGAPLVAGEAGVSGNSRTGATSSAITSSAAIGALIDTGTTDNTTISLSAEPDEYGYFAYPAGLGLATFLDVSFGTTGGWDGATSGTGPLTVSRSGEDWYVYRTDDAGVFGTYQVSLQNPGIPVGASEDVPHLKTSAAGLYYVIRLDFDQIVDAAPSMVAPVGSWIGTWSKLNNTRWERTLRVSNSDARGLAQFSGLSVENRSGMLTSAFTSGGYYAVSGFSKLLVTFPAFARSAPIGAVVSNVLNTSANYAGSADLLSLRTDTRDAPASYSIVDSSGNYIASGGTHIWLSDDQYAGANTSSTLKVEIEESV